ncbi:unnamed protein product, partial [Closterium sp. NIES-54]
MAAQELRWLTYLLTDLGEPPRSPPVLYVDNKAMLALCREQRLKHRTKHIALRYFLARELQQRGQLRLAYVASEANTADVFTKALAPCDHQRLCTQLGSGHEAGATDKGKAAAQSNLWPSISSYLPATLGELLPSAVNTYIVLIHVYLACSTVVLILWSLGVSQSRIMHYLHQQLLAGRTTLLELKKHALDSMAHIISCLHQHLLATRTTFLKLMNDALDFM